MQRKYQATQESVSCAPCTAVGLRQRRPRRARVRPARVALGRPGRAAQETSSRAPLRRPDLVRIEMARVRTVSRALAAAALILALGCAEAASPDVVELAIDQPVLKGFDFDVGFTLAWGPDSNVAQGASARSLANARARARWRPTGAPTAARHSGSFENALHACSWPWQARLGHGLLRLLRGHERLAAARRARCTQRAAAGARDGTFFILFAVAVRSCAGARPIATLSVPSAAARRRHRGG